MNKLLTPKQVARAIQVSESSIKRWCDKGTIPTQYTAGGHRRIPLSGLMVFLRDTKHQLVRPEVLGLPAMVGQTERVIGRAEEQLRDALLSGDEALCRRILLDLYLSEHNLSKICDQVVAPAFESIGNLWGCGDAEVYQERRSCEICTRVLHELRSLLVPPPPDSPMAIGGTIEGDMYTLATTMVELVLIDRGWRATSLGTHLPFNTLTAAIEQQRPKLFWLSVSYLEDTEEFMRSYAELYEMAGLQVAFVVGGQALVEPVRQRMKYAAFCDCMQHLEAFAQTMHPHAC